MAEMRFIVPAPFSKENPRLRLHPVIGDNMEPGLRAGRDAVLVQPCDCWNGEGVYLIGQHGINLSRVTGTLKPGAEVEISSDSPLYPVSEQISAERFAEIVLAKVVANVIVQDRRLLNGDVI
jgi:hypothetical protein